MMTIDGQIEGEWNRRRFYHASSSGFICFPFARLICECQRVFLFLVEFFHNSTLDVTIAESLLCTT